MCVSSTRRRRREDDDEDDDDDLHMDRQTSCFTVANFRHTGIKLSKSQNSNENRRYSAELAAPDFANSGKKTCAFPYVNSKVY